MERLPPRTDGINARPAKWVHLDSNQGPAGYEPDALTAELWTRKSPGAGVQVYHRALLASGAFRAGVVGSPPLPRPGALGGFGDGWRHLVHPFAVLRFRRQIFGDEITPAR